jgi:hypothetical protein
VKILLHAGQSGLSSRGPRPNACVARYNILRSRARVGEYRTSRTLSLRLRQANRKGFFADLLLGVVAALKMVRRLD